ADTLAAFLRQLLGGAAHPAGERQHRQRCRQENQQMVSRREPLQCDRGRDESQQPLQHDAAPIKSMLPSCVRCIRSSCTVATSARKSINTQKTLVPGDWPGAMLEHAMPTGSQVTMIA